jgi:hypothetical protein
MPIVKIGGKIPEPDLVFGERSKRQRRLVINIVKRGSGGWRWMAVKHEAAQNNTIGIFFIRKKIQAQFSILVKIAKLEIGNDIRITGKIIIIVDKLPVDRQVTFAAIKIRIVVAEKIDLILAVVKSKTCLSPWQQVQYIMWFEYADRCPEHNGSVKSIRLAFLCFYIDHA